MKRHILALTILSIGLFSCNKEPKPPTKEEIAFRIDSITQSRIKDIDTRAKIDLEHRIKIEVKVKVDSILNARSLQAAKDTTKKITPAKL